jgi:hypothetical protein
MQGELETASVPAALSALTDRIIIEGELRLGEARNVSVKFTAGLSNGFHPWIDRICVAGHHRGPGMAPSALSHAPR